MNVIVPSAPNQMLGTFRRFGLVGPVYEITRIGDQLNDGDWMLRVKVVTTGEEVDYRLNDALDDPKAD